MITDALLTILNGLVAFLVAILPNWTMSIPAGLHQTMQNLLQLDPILPIHETFICAGWSVTVMVSATAVKWTKWVIEQIVGVIP